MQIFLVNKPSKVAGQSLWDLKAHRLFSYFSIIDLDCAYGEKERFNEFLALLISEKSKKHGILILNKGDKTMTDFKENIAIDKYSLDLEFEKHPMLYHEFALDMINAEDERDRAKDQLELFRAELDVAIRHDPKAFHIEKLTEAAIISTILKIEKFKIAQDYFNTCVSSVRILKIAVESINQKKTALENLVKLYLGEYYSKEVPKEIKESISEKVSDFIHEDLNKPTSRLLRNAS